MSPYRAGMIERAGDGGDRPPLPDPESSGWVSVRCILHTERQGSRFYEERITLWQASSMAEAVERAETEAHEYARDTSSEGDTTIYAGLAQAYLLFDDLEDGAEVYSLVRRSDLAPEDYLDTFFDTGAERTQGTLDDAETGESGEGIPSP